MFYFGEDLATFD